MGNILTRWARATEETSTQEKQAGWSPANVKWFPELPPLAVHQQRVVEVPDYGIRSPADGNEDKNSSDDEDDAAGDSNLCFRHLVFHEVGALSSHETQEDSKHPSDDGDDHQGSGALQILRKSQQRIIDLTLHLSCALNHTVHP